MNDSFLIPFNLRPSGFIVFKQHLWKGTEKCQFYDTGVFYTCMHSLSEDSKDLGPSNQITWKSPEPKCAQEGSYIQPQRRHHTVALTKGLHINPKSFLRGALMIRVRCGWSLMKPSVFAFFLMPNLPHLYSLSPCVAAWSLFDFKD